MRHLLRGRHTLPACCWVLWVLLVPAVGPGAGVGLAAQEEALVTDRPDFTESPVSVDPKRVQLELGYTNEEAEVRTQSFGELLVRIGLAAGVELRLGANSYVRESAPGPDSSGIENASIGVKIETSAGSEEPRFLKPATALLISTTLPTGASEVNESDFEPGVLLALDWPLTDRLGIASNVGMIYASVDGDQFLAGQFSLSLAIDLGRGWGNYVEYFDILPGSSDHDDRHFANTGLTYLISPDFQLDFRIGTEISGETDYFVGLGAAYRF